MASLAELRDVARRAGDKHLPDGFVSEVLIEPSTGADGSDTLHVRFVVNGDPVQQLDGDTLVDTLVAISQAFQQAGDDRSPMVDYLTRADLDDHGDPES